MYDKIKLDKKNVETKERHIYDTSSSTEKGTKKIKMSEGQEFSVAYFQIMKNLIFLYIHFAKHIQEKHNNI